MEGQQLEQKSKFTQTPSYLPSDSCKYFFFLKKKEISGHWKYNCPVCREKIFFKEREELLQVGQIKNFKRLRTTLLEVINIFKKIIKQKCVLHPICSWTRRLSSICD